MKFVGLVSVFVFAAVVDLGLAHQNDACADSDPVQCPLWTQNGECVLNPSFMQLNCRVSCDTCGLSIHEINREFVRQAKQRGERCFDDQIHCSEWAKRGECVRNNQLFLVCKRSCGKCTERKSKISIRAIVENGGYGEVTTTTTQGYGQPEETTTTTTEATTTQGYGQPEETTTTTTEATTTQGYGQPEVEETTTTTTEATTTQGYGQPEETTTTTTEATTTQGYGQPEETTTTTTEATTTQGYGQPEVEETTTTTTTTTEANGYEQPEGTPPPVVTSGYGAPSPVDESKPDKPVVAPTLQPLPQAQGY